MKNDHWIEKKYQRWEKMYKRLGHSLLTIGVLVGAYGILLIMQGNHQTGFLLFILGPILLIASCLCYYVFTEPTSLREYLINSYDERNRAIRQKTQAYCFLSICCSLCCASDILSKYDDQRAFWV